MYWYWARLSSFLSKLDSRDPKKKALNLPLKICFRLYRGKKWKLRLPGVEPGSIAWKAIILTVGLQTPCYWDPYYNNINPLLIKASLSIMNIIFLFSFSPIPLSCSYGVAFSKPNYLCNPTKFPKEEKASKPNSHKKDSHTNWAFSLYYSLQKVWFPR